MHINNPLQMHNWEIRKFLKVVLATQLTMLGVIGLGIIGLQIPILRQLIGFIYLIFIPGIIIIRILKLHELTTIETLLYAVGLSLTTLMFTGLFMNTVYPIFGVSEPISVVPLIFTISAVVLVLCILSYVHDKDFSNPNFIDVKEILSPHVLGLCLLPFLAIIGTYLMNFHNNNALLLFLIVILSILPIFMISNRFPEKLYPFSIFIIAISLLYHRSLISMSLWGTDIHTEYYLSNLVIQDSCWDSTIPITYNAMLSIVMLAPIFSDICCMSLTWVFKIIYPLLFSLVPLGLYQVFQKQTDDKIAFLSCFFFMSSIAFYTILLWVARQQIAELFYVLLILLMISKDMDKIKRSFLFTVFGFSLVVSHYGLSYIHMFLLSSIWLISVLAKNPKIQKIGDDFYDRIGRYKTKGVATKPIALNVGDKTIRSTCVLLFITFALTWYMYVSSSSGFNAMVHIGDRIAGSILTDFLNPEEVEALHIIVGEAVSPLHSITKYLNLVAQFFISIGILALLLKCSGTKFEKEYSSFSLIFFVICLVSLAVPFTSREIGTDRLYHITLLFLAPFCVIGYITIFNMLSRVSGASWTNKSVRSTLKVLSVFFMIFLLFNSGFIYEVANDVYPTSISLNSTIVHPRFHFTDGEAHSARWLVNTVKDRYDIYVDDSGRFILREFTRKIRSFDGDTDYVLRNSYIFIGLLNVRHDEVVMVEHGPKGFFRTYPKLSNSTFYNKVIIYANKIYDNGDGQVYYHS